MKRFFILALIASILFASCKNENFIEYIEKGFAKPTMEDAHFSKSNLGDGNKLYVPSDEEIEVEFTIKNKHANELIGSLEFGEDKKALFSTEPYIKSLTPTKMVVAFNFKADAEPSATNSFLGETVEISLKIFEKSTGRYLSSQTFNASCNTPPPAMKAESLEYKEGTDTYVVTLPQGVGKHQDLKEVRFTLSSEYGNETVEPKVMSVLDVGEQGKQYTLGIKGNQGWQLKNPSGQRTIKAIVYDRAGLRSSEGENKTNRYFASITFNPSEQTSTVVQAKENGVPVSKIKELENFFTGDDWYKAGYRVGYSCEGFTYNADKQVFEKADVSVGTYTVTVKLTKIDNSSYEATNTYLMKIEGSSEAKVNESKFKIEDVTNTYSGEGQRLTFSQTISYSETTGTATVEVPYTGRETKLKVHVETASKHCKGGKDGDGTSWGDGIKEKDYNIIIDENGPGKELKFSLIAEDDTEWKHTITFTRGPKVEVKIKFENEELLGGSDVVAKASMAWEKYKKEVKMEYTPGMYLSNDTISVRAGAEVKFNIELQNGAKIRTCKSSITAHDTSTLASNGGKLKLQATESFTLTVTLAPEVTVKWIDFGKNIPESTPCGYTSGNIDYIDINGTSFNDTVVGNDRGRAVKKASDVTFKITDLNKETHFVEKWIVNGETVTESGEKFELEDNNTTLKILNVYEDYNVKVVTKRLFNVTVKIGRFDINFHEEGNTKYKIEVLNKTASPSVPVTPKESTPTTAYTFTKIKEGTELEFKAIEEAGSNWEIQSWRIREGDSGATSPFNSGSTDNIQTKVINNNTLIELCLKKKEVTLNVMFLGEKGNVLHGKTLKLMNTRDNSPIGITENTQTNPHTYTAKVLRGEEVKLTVINPTGTIAYAIDKWKIKRDGDSGFANFDGEYVGSDNLAGKMRMEKNTDIEIVLMPQYTFKLTRKSDASTGELKITSGNATTLLTLNNTTPKLLKTNGEMFLEISELDSKDHVISYRKNSTTEYTSLLNSDTGFWKLGKEKLTELKPGDTFEAVIARMKPIMLSVQNEDGSLYDNVNYNLMVKNANPQDDHVLLPRFNNNSVSINYVKIPSNKLYHIYITEGTKLDFNMDLPEDKEIGKWTRDSATLDSQFNDEPNKPELIIGEKQVLNYKPTNNYNEETIIAQIRDKTYILTCSIKDYDNKRKTEDAKIKLYVNYSDGNAEIGNFSGNEDCPKKYRIKNGKTIKLKIEEEAGNDYYFAEWEDGNSVSGQDKFNKEVDINVSNRDLTVSALCTKNVIVVVHPIMGYDKDNDNFPGGYFPGDDENFPFGSAYPGKKTHGNNVDSPFSILCNEGGIRSTSVPINQLNTPDAGGLAVVFSKPNLTYANANVYWRYTFGGNGDVTPEYDSWDDKPEHHKGIKFSGTPGKMLEFSNAPRCVFVHIWLRKVQVYP